MIFGFLNIVLFFILVSFNVLAWNEEIVVITLLLISLTTIIINLGDSLNKNYATFASEFIKIYNLIFAFFIQFNNIHVSFLIFLKYVYANFYISALVYFISTTRQIITFLYLYLLNLYIWLFFSKCLMLNTNDTNQKTIVLGAFKKLPIKVY